MSAVEPVIELDDDEDENRDHPCRPFHSKKYGQFTIEWYRACDNAFKAAYRAAMMAERSSEQSSVTVLCGYYIPERDNGN